MRLWISDCKFVKAKHLSVCPLVALVPQGDEATFTWTDGG
jgi:hypothetical protein